MTEALVSQVYLQNAFLKGGDENLATKFAAIAFFLWKSPEFFKQGPMVSAGTIQKRFHHLLKEFRDSGERANLSAIAEIPTAMNKTLEEIHNIIAEREHGEKKKKRVISDITDVIVRGGGRKGLEKLAADTS